MDARVKAFLEKADGYVEYIDVHEDGASVALDGTYNVLAGVQAVATVQAAELRRLVAIKNTPIGKAKPEDIEWVRDHDLRFADADDLEMVADWLEKGR